MFSTPENGLQLSWLNGTIFNVALVNPVLDARMVCIGDETEVRALRESLERIFERWREETGTLPEATVGLLGSFNIYEGKTLAECPPYACMGELFTDYYDLLVRLRNIQYAPLLELETQASNVPIFNPLLQPISVPGLPPIEAKPGMQRILAALILSEAAAGRVQCATKTHWELKRIQHDTERQQNEAMRPVQEMMRNFARAGIKAQQGYKSRDEFQDRLDCQAIAKTMWTENPSLTIAALLRTPDIARYVRKYPGKNTVWDWLSEIDPRPPEKKRGRRKSS